MRITDTVKLAQSNLVRSKLRTALTVIAVFIGALTLSLTNGVGSGVRAYVDRELGNIGAETTMIIQAKQTGQNPIDTDVQEYDPDAETGVFNINFLTKDDQADIEAIDGLSQVEPLLNLQIAYITTGEKKLVARAEQFIEGLNMQMSAGRVVDVNATDEASIPERFVEPLGFESVDAAIGQTLLIGSKNALGQEVQMSATIVGVQASSLLGSGSISVSNPLALALIQQQAAGVPELEAQAANRFFGYTAQFPADYTDSQITELKQRISDAGFEGMTIQDQIGIISQVIDALIMGLNLFGVIALLAASFGIVNTLLMAVNERTREIGLMKALGSSRRSIFATFSLEAMSLGFWGALLGILASIVIGQLINSYATETFLKDFEGFNLLAFPLIPSLAILGIIVLIAFIAGALPSLKASRLDPIEALRYE